MSNPPKSLDSSVEDPETIFDIVVLAKLLLIPRVPLSLMLVPTGGGYADVVPSALDILPILISVPVAGITPTFFYFLYGVCTHIKPIFMGFIITQNLTRRQTFIPKLKRRNVVSTISISLTPSY